jgi:DNA-binding GntR family transcriptional regulator
MQERPHQSNASEDTEEASQVDRCFRQLRDLIVSCELKPGQRITEKTLIAQTGFGRTPLREALLRLERDGLVSIFPRSGYMISPISEQSINDLYDVWRLIGPLIARSAYYKMTSEIRESIAALELPASEFAKLSPLEKSRHVARHFDILAQTSGNSQLIYIYRRLAAEMARFFVFFLASERGMGWLHKEGELRQLAYSSDPDAVAARIADAIRLSQEGILACWRELEARLSSAPSDQGGGRKRRRAKDSDEAPFA